MIYNITLNQPPMMPFLGKGTDCVKLLLSKASPDMREPLVPMLFPPLGAHISGAEFKYPDNTWKETTGMMSSLVADSGGNKGQFTHVVEAICRDFRAHDNVELERLYEWQHEMKTKGANKEKPPRPDVALLFPPSDITAPAFIQNSLGCESKGGLTQMINMSELEMADRLCGGHRQVSQMIRNIYDRQRAGALRATADGVTGNPLLRTNITLSATPYSARNFFKNELLNGTMGRIVFSYKPRTGRDGRIPRVGKYDEAFYSKLDVFLERLTYCKGRFEIKPLNKMVDKIAEDMARLADLHDDDLLWDLSKRSLVSAWKDGCVLWVLNNRVLTKAMGELVEWAVYHDLWSKVHVFSDMLGKNQEAMADYQRHGPKNMLDSLPDTFSKMQLCVLRKDMGRSEEGADAQLRKWVYRKFVEYSEQTGLYSKTSNYLDNFKKK